MTLQPPSLPPIHLRKTRSSVMTSKAKPSRLCARHRQGMDGHGPKALAMTAQASAPIPLRPTEAPTAVVGVVAVMASEAKPSRLQACTRP